jgi:hypothetical protein
MALFGRKIEKSDEMVEQIKRAVEENKIPEIPIEIQNSPLSRLLEEKPLQERQIPEKSLQMEIKPKIEAPVEMERPSFAPLFVKIDRYRQILTSIGNLKTTMIMIKNSMMTLAELDKARDETFKLVQNAIGKLENKLNTLDQELVRPTGFMDRPTPSYESHATIDNQEYQDMETVEATIADLKGQIEQLKLELDAVV